MPTPIKLILSVIVAVVAGLAYYLGLKGGWVVPALGAAMIGAVWLFPERRPEGGEGG